MSLYTCINFIKKAQVIPTPSQAHHKLHDYVETSAPIRIRSNHGQLIIFEVVIRDGWAYYVLYSEEYGCKIIKFCAKLESDLPKISYLI